MLNLTVNNLYTCQYCKHQFKQEKTLAIHICEQKRRYIAKAEKHVIIGYQTFVRFYQLTQDLNKTKSYDEFAKAPYYNAMVKFGSFVNNIKPLYPAKFIDWIIKSGIKLDYWCREEHYEKYVIELIHSEAVETALQRSVLHMQDWASDNNSTWDAYFKQVSTNRAVYDIKDGKVSPWLILTCASGKAMLSNFRDDQLSSVQNIIDPVVWVKKFKAKAYDLSLVKQIISSSAL